MRNKKAHVRWGDDESKPVPGDDEENLLKEIVVSFLLLTLNV